MTAEALRSLESLGGGDGNGWRRYSQGRHNLRPKNSFHLHDSPMHKPLGPYTKLRQVASVCHGLCISREYTLSEMRRLAGPYAGAAPPRPIEAAGPDGCPSALPYKTPWPDRPCPAARTVAQAGSTHRRTTAAARSDPATCGSPHQPARPGSDRMRVCRRTSAYPGATWRPCGTTRCLLPAGTTQQHA